MAMEFESNKIIIKRASGQKQKKQKVDEDHLCGELYIKLFSVKALHYSISDDRVKHPERK